MEIQLTLTSLNVKGQDHLVTLTRGRKNKTNKKNNNNKKQTQ